MFHGFMLFESGNPDIQLQNSRKSANSGIRIFGNPETQNFGYPEFRTSGNADFRESHVLEFRNSENPDFPTFGITEIRISGFTEFRMSGIPEVQWSGYPDICNAIKIPDVRICICSPTKNDESVLSVCNVFVGYGNGLSKPHIFKVSLGKVRM